MTKHFVIWKPIWSKDIAGERFLNPYILEFIANSYKGRLLGEIIAMQPQKAISLAEAANLATEEYHQAMDAGRVGSEPGHNRWYCENFVSWMAELGFHIEITGDEFEPALMSGSLI